MSAKLIFLAGSARKESLNKKLAKAAADMAAELGAQVTYIDLANYPMPILCEDYEAENGAPESAQKLKKLFAEHDGFLISSPEYNSSFSPLLKNTLDWLSRPAGEGEEIHIPFKGKVSAIVAASPGAIGGLRGLPALRMLLTNIAMFGTHVIPAQFALGNAHNAFDENGKLSNDQQRGMLENVIKQFIETAKALR